MAKQHTIVALQDTFAVQHAQDEYYIRPLILGENLFTYVAHIPAGGGVPPYPEAAKKYQIEHSLYVLSGKLQICIDGRSATLVSHTAARIPAGQPVEMVNVGDRPASIYMAYSPSRWGPSAADDDRRGVTSLEAMRSWYDARGQRVWSAAEMSADTDMLLEDKVNLTTLIEAYRLSSQKESAAQEMLWAALWATPGYRHEHKPHPPDDFWFRPIVCGEQHLTYIGLVPPGKRVPPSPEEAGVVEMSVYTLSGDLGCTILREAGQEPLSVVLPPHNAIYAPKSVPIGFFSPSESPSVFALTFTPTRPGRDSILAFENWAVNTAGWTVIDAKPLNEMFGTALWD